MKRKILLLTIVFTINFAFAQKRYENKQLGFSIEEPNKWIEASNEEVMENLEKQVSYEKLSELLKNNKGSISVANFYKYKTNEHPGLIPTIKVLMRQNVTTNFTDFKSMISQSSKSFEKMFPDLEFIQEPNEILIDGIKSVYFIVKYSMKTQSGTMKIKSRIYAVPHGKFLYQINFIDGQTEDDCTAEFDKLVKTIKIGVEK